MTSFLLTFKLITDATFGRGDGVAGVVDNEVEHDEYGLPYLGGRALKGLLEEECANILFSLKKQGKGILFFESASHLFGCPGSTHSDEAILHEGAAKLPEDLRKAIAHANIEREEVLKSLTAIRVQTAIDEELGAPKKGSLRNMRVVLRKTPFLAELSFLQEPSDMDMALLSACVKAFRRAGTGRNRGKGELIAQLCNEKGKEMTDEYFSLFENEVLK